MKRIFNLIIVDESGSMCVIEKQALMGMNETLQTIQKMQKLHNDMEQHVTLMTFDSGHKNFIYDNCLAKDAKPLSARDYRPGGCTPLYDAIGVSIAKLNAQTADGDHVLVTIITDGEENSSEEYSLEMIKTLINKLKKQNWTFTLIGTDDLDVEGMADSMGIDDNLQFAETEEATKQMFTEDCKAREHYNLCTKKGMPCPSGTHFSHGKKK